MGGHGDYIRLVYFFAANEPGSLQAIHLWHLHIHENNIVRSALQGGQDLFAIGCRIGLVA